VAHDKLPEKGTLLAAPKRLGWFGRPSDPSTTRRTKMNVHSIRLIANEVAKTIPIVCCAALLMGGTASASGDPKAGGLNPSTLITKVSKDKQTTLGLYVTAAQAYEKWKAAPDKVKLIDVRTPEEYAFVGHPEMALNIPYAFVNYQRKNGKTEYGPRLNSEFVAEVKKFTKPGDTLLVMCRSGGRSAKAVDLLAAAGIKNAYSVIDGVEGDKVTDPDSVFFGKRMKNGWKNTAPWVYDIDPEKLILGEGAAKQTAK
jgi:rhodanese-related sulfurtransferase